MENCIKCKAALPEGALFCPMCGKKQTATAKKRRKRANGTGSVTKKAGNRAKPWEAQKDGVYIGCYETRHEAERALSKLSDPRVTERLNLTFAQVYDRWKPEHAREVSKQGIAGYESAYKHCASLHDRTFRKLRASDFQGVIIEMEESGLAKSTCEKVVQLFGQLSKWAIREEISHTNYAQFVTVLAKQKKEKVPFTDTQIKSIQNAKSPAVQIALILLATGCRPNELFSAKTTDCHEDYFISGSKTEAGKNRVIPVSTIGAQAYTDLLETAKSRCAERLIGGYDGNKTTKNFARRDWTQLMKECGIDGMSPYNCRHTYTTLAVKAGVKPEMLQKILGHADYSTTVGVYTHLDMEDILQESKKVTVTDKLQTQENDA